MKELIERYKSESKSELNSALERDIYLLVTLDLMEYLKDSAKIEQKPD